MPEMATCRRCGERYQVGGKGILGTIAAGIQLLERGFDSVGKCERCVYIEMAEEKYADFDLMGALASIRMAKRSDDNGEAGDLQKRFAREFGSIANAGIRILQGVAAGVEDEEEIKAIGFCLYQLHCLAEKLDNKRIATATKGGMMLLKSQLL